MKTINIYDINKNFFDYVERIESGENFIVTRDNIPLFEIKTLKNNKKSRPFGLCKGEFVVPDDFDMPLPEDIIDSFEGNSK